MSPEQALEHIQRLYKQRHAFGRDSFEQAAGVILDLGNFDTQQTEKIRQRIAALAQTLPIVLTTSQDVSEAQRLCRQAADRLRGAAGYAELIQDWPAPIAHEVWQLTALLAGDGREAPAPEAALLQLRDTAETLIKLPASVLARRLIERGGEDAQEMRRRLAGVVGGSWNDLARNAAARLRRAEPHGPLTGIALLFTDSALYRLMVEALAAARNRYLGHGALRGNPAETAALVAWFAAARPGERPPLDAPSTISLVGGLTAAVAAKPWPGLRLQALAEDGPIALTGAAALTAWQQDARHAGHLIHRDVILPVRLVIDDEPALSVSPLVAARICLECGRRDVFFFDNVYRWRRTDPAQIDFLDYGRGHKSRYDSDGAPDLCNELAGVPPEAIPPPSPDSGLGSGAAIARLDRMRIDLRYRSPQHLRQPFADFLNRHECGIYWLQAPAHVGKTTFVHGLAERVLSDRPIVSGLEPGSGGGIAAFYCKREYREGRITFLNGLAETLKDALDLRRDASQVFPDIETVNEADEPRQAFVTWLDEWRALAPAARRKLLVVVDGLDEADPPGGDSLLDLLPSAAALTPGLYLLLTSRLVGDTDCPAWLGPALAPLMTGETAAMRQVTLDDPGYLDLLREYISRILGDAVSPEFGDELIGQAEQRFVFVGFLVEQLRGGQITAETLEALGTGAAIYDRFIDGLEARYGAKRADDLLTVLCCLAAAELAHGWIFGEGAVRDGATGGILEPLPREWPGLELDLLASAAGMDEIADDRNPGFGAAFLEALILLQGALWVWRGEARATRYRLGLKELAARLTAQRAIAVSRAHARLAGLCLDAVGALEDDSDSEREPGSRDERTLRGLFALLPGLVRLAGTERLHNRYSRLPVINIALDVEASFGDQATPSLRQISWYSGALAALHHGAGPLLSNPEQRNFEARAYVNRGVAKRSAPGHGALAAVADFDAAIAAMVGLRAAVGEDWPPQWRSDLAAAYSNRGNAKQDVPNYGALAAIADHDAAIEIMEDLRKAHGEGWPAAWHNIHAMAYMNRGNAKQNAPRYGALEAIADYDAAIAIREGTRESVGEEWLPQWLNSLAATYMNRGAAKRSAPRYGALAAIADYDAAIAIREGLRTMLGESWPLPWRNDLAAVYLNRGSAKWSTPSYGALAAIADYNVAIATMEELREALGEGWPPPWCNDLAGAYMSRGIAKQSAPGHGEVTAIVDYDRAIALMEELRNASGEDWPPRWHDNLAGAYVNRGTVKRSAPGYGASAAIADYDAAIAIREELREAFGENWPPQWGDYLAGPYFNRAQVHLQLDNRQDACADALRAVKLWTDLSRIVGKGPWTSYVAQAKDLVAQACEPSIAGSWNGLLSSFRVKVRQWRKRLRL